MSEEIKNKERTAVEVLLSIENKLETLIKTVSVNDLTQKIILDRLNKLVSGLVPVSEEEKNKIESVKIQKGEKISAITEPQGQRRIIKSEIKSQTSHHTKKIPVTQRVTDGTGKDLFMAKVEFLNSENEIVDKTQTNANGKWQMNLFPGNYSVKITKTVKTKEDEQKKLEALQSLEVKEEDSTIVMPVAIIR